MRIGIVVVAILAGVVMGGGSSFAAECGGIGYTGTDSSYCLKCHSPCVTATLCKGEPSGCAKIPSDFPLNKGNVTCVTCHEMKREKADGMFLRGNVDSDRPMSFCFNCHSEKCYSKFNPHEGMWFYSGKKLRQTCAYCHGKENAADAKKVCVGCHTKTPHPGAVEHLGESTSVKTLPTVNGKIHCITCHNPHPSTFDKHKGKLLNGVAEKVSKADFDTLIKELSLKNLEHVDFKNGSRQLMRMKTENGELCLQCHGDVVKE